MVSLLIRISKPTNYRLIRAQARQSRHCRWSHQFHRHVHNLHILLQSLPSTRTRSPNPPLPRLVPTLQRLHLIILPHPRRLHLRLLCIPQRRMGRWKLLHVLHDVDLGTYQLHGLEAVQEDKVDQGGGMRFNLGFAGY